MVNPLVSVIIPIYNVGSYLKECLDSVVNQSYQEIEIIAINDGSTDNSKEILNQYAADHPIIKVIDQENSGQSVSRNKGIKVAKGKYVYFLDADDYILPETIANLVDQLEENELDLIRFAAEPFADGVDYSVYKKQYDFQKQFEEGKVYHKEAFLSVNLKAYSMSPCLYIVQKRLLIDNDIEFKPGITHEDELFTLAVFLNTNKAMYDPNFYYKRRYRADSVMTTNRNKNIKKSFDSYCVVMEEMSKLLQQYNHPLEEKLIKRRLCLLYGMLKNMELNSDYKNNRLKQIKGLKKREKLYFNMRYKARKQVKKLIFK